MPTETSYRQRCVDIHIPSFNEAVGSCPRKPTPAAVAGGQRDASMRPWARAHGNDANGIALTTGLALQ